MALTPEELEQMKKAAAAQVPLMPADGVNPLARGIEMAGGNPSVLQPTPPQITAQTAEQNAVGQMAERGAVQTGPASFGRPELMPQQLPEGAEVNIGFDKPSTPLTTPEATAIRETEQGLTSTLNVDGGSVTVPQSLASQTFGVPNAPMGVEATQSMLQERFGAPTISAIQSAPEGLGLPTDAQGRMIDPTVDRSAYDAASQARSDAAGLSPSGAYKRSDAAVSDAERRGEKPFSTYVDLAGGDRDLARTMQVREREGLDPMTGREPKPDDTRTPEQVEADKLRVELMKQDIADGNKPDSTKLQKRKGELAEALDAGIITQEQYDDQLKRSVLGNPPSGYDTWSQYEKETGVDADGDGKVGGAGDSTAETQNAGSTPAASTTPQEFDSVEAAEAANLPKGTKIVINGRTATVQ